MIRKLLQLGALLGVLAVLANAGTIAGNIQTATGGSVVNGTLGFTLSQPAVLSGTATLVTSQTNCYTSTSGNIVGVPDPIVPPVLSVSTASGTLAAGTYYVKLTYVGAGGQSFPGPEASIVLSAQGTVFINAPILQPANATGFYTINISSTSGTETLQATATGWTQYAQSVPLVSGAALPSTNTSVCSLAFSDTLVPTGTFYTVSLVNKNGSIISGFPQTWCTYGGLSGTINVSVGAPVGNCGTNGVFYPTPLFSSQLNGAGTQSVGGNLAIGGNETVGGNETIAGNLSVTGTLNITGLQTLNGEIVRVSGTGCGQLLQLQNIDSSPTNPNKYLRVNRTTGALELVNSACVTTILSIDDTGAITSVSSTPSSFAGNLLAPQFLGIANTATVFGPGACTASVVCTATLQAGRNSLGAGVFNGLDAIINAGNGAVSGAGGNIRLNVGTDFSGGTPPSVIANAPVTAPSFQVNGTAQFFYVAADFTLAGNTNLQTITGLSFPLTANLAQKVPFSCHLMYSQATAAVADQFGIQSTLLAPTNIAAKAQVYISASTLTAGNMPTLATTTATPIVTFTPSAITTIWNADIDGFVENPSGVATVINMMAQTSNASDLVTIKKDSFCRLY